jgi:hypothetical protein
MLVTLARLGIAGVNFATNIMQNHRLLATVKTSHFARRTPFLGGMTTLFNAFPRIITKNICTTSLKALSTTQASKVIHQAVNLNFLSNISREGEHQKAIFNKPNYFVSNFYSITTQHITETQMRKSKEVTEMLSPIKQRLQVQRLQNSEVTLNRKNSIAIEHVTPSPNGPMKPPTFIQNGQHALFTVNQQKPIYASKTPGNLLLPRATAKKPIQQVTPARLELHVLSPQTTLNHRVMEQTLTVEPFVLEPGISDQLQQETPTGNSVDVHHELVNRENIVKQTTTKETINQPIIQKTTISKTEVPMQGSNINELAEKIFRLIERKSRIERERRGF